MKVTVDDLDESLYYVPKNKPELNGIEFRREQLRLIKNAVAAKRGILVSPTGCHIKGTKIMLFNGHSKNIEDVVVGDKLMGDDNTPRNVLSLCRGFGNMYEITPRKGESFIVNDEHILSLDYRGNKGKRRIVNISVKDYLNKSNDFKWNAFLYRTKTVSFNKEKKIDSIIDPYILGIWLGDGNNKHFTVDNPDREIQQELEKFSEKMDMRYKITVTKKRNKDNSGNDLRCPKITIINNKRGGLNKLRQELKRLNVLGNKHTP
jgi:replicative DNA helicase